MWGCALQSLTARVPASRSNTQDLLETEWVPTVGHRVRPDQSGRLCSAATRVTSGRGLRDTRLSRDRSRPRNRRRRMFASRAGVRQAGTRARPQAGRRGRFRPRARAREGRRAEAEDARRRPRGGAPLPASGRTTPTTPAKTAATPVAPARRSRGRGRLVRPGESRNYRCRDVGSAKIERYGNSFENGRIRRISSVGSCGVPQTCSRAQPLKLDRNPCLAARAASRKSSIRAGQAEKCGVKSMG